MAKRKSRKKKRNVFIRSVVSAILMLGVIALIALGVTKLMSMMKSDGSAKAEEAAEEKQVVTIDGMDTAHYTQKAMKNALMEKHPWELSIDYEGNETQVDNALAEAVDDLVSEAYGCQESRDFELSLDEASAKKMADMIADNYAQNTVVSEADSEAMVFDAESNQFVYHNAKAVKTVDSEKLSELIAESLLSGDYTAKITCPVKEVSASYSPDDFKMIGTYTTHTTANADRNTNVSNACKTINGLVLMPGEQFSYNGVLGRRTEEKGYKPAGAYSNGEHVMELGGGVCQVSSTIYNAVIAANLQVDARTGHTYEPTYVTPGNDATVSYEQPDFRFTNSTNAPVGLKVSFANRTVTVEIYGVPQLEEGVKRYLKSEKMTDLEPPMPSYVEDPMIVPGFEVMDKNAKCGSKWQTMVVLEKNGEIIEEEYLHTTTYKGEPAVIRRNTMGGTIAPEHIQQVDTATGQVVAPQPAENVQEQQTQNEATPQSRLNEDGGEAP